MKTQKFLFNQIVEFKNLELAFYKASKRKHSAMSYLYFRKNKAANILQIKNRLISGNYNIGNYKQFKIYEPKERNITAAPFGDRVIHHAIINILEPIFENTLIFHTYACRKGKGTYAAIYAVQNHIRKNQYFLKLDIRKYFDSINHNILKELLCRLIKDKKCLDLLFAIIDSYKVDSFTTTEMALKGIPIGNLTSQFFANYFLSCLDHFVVENLKPQFYCRYMDDMILLDFSKEKLLKCYKQMEVFIQQNLNLEFKPPIIGKTYQGIPFLGKLITKENVKLLTEKRKLKEKKIKKIDYLVRIGKISQEKGAERIRAILVGM